MSAVLAAAWLATIAAHSLLPDPNRVPREVQPISLVADGGWRLELDPLASDLDSPCDVDLWNAGERVLSTRWTTTPFTAALSDTGSIAVLSDAFLRREQYVRVLDRDGSVLAEHEFEPLPMPDGRRVRILDVVWHPGLGSFVVMLEATAPWSRYTRTRPVLETVGAFVLLDSHSGRIERPLKLWARRGNPLRMLPVDGTPWTAVEIERQDSGENHVVVFDEEFVVLGAIENGVRHKLERQTALLIGSPAAAEVVVRRRGSREQHHYALVTGPSGFSAEVVRVELDPATPRSATVRPVLSAKVELEVPESFVSCVVGVGSTAHGFAGLDELGRICMQDADTNDIIVLEGDGRFHCKLELNGMDDASDRRAWEIHATRNGGFLVQTRSARWTFGPTGLHLGSEGKGSVRHIDVEDQLWVHDTERLYRVGDRPEEERSIERHDDGRFFTALYGVQRSRDRLIVLDNTHWLAKDEWWRGRISQYSLEGEALSTTELSFEPGGREVRLIACALPWILMEGSSCSQGGVEVRSWLADLDDGFSSRLDWPHPGRSLGFMAGPEIVRLDDGARALRRYALPQR